MPKQASMNLIFVPRYSFFIIMWMQL